jgi:putative spermidine/putrescine transport system permease protein
MAVPARGWIGDRAACRLLVAPALLLMAGAYFLPLAQVAWLSVTDPAPGLGNYAQLADNAAIRHVLLVTARVCCVTTAITLVLAYAVAYALTQAGPRARGLMLAGVLLPLWVSVLARAFAWTVLLRRAGLVNALLLATGLIRRPLPLMWNEFGVVLGMVHAMLPYGILPLAAQMGGIDPRLAAAARGLGAGRAQAFRRVFLPLSLPGVAGAGVLVFIFSLGFYVTPALLGGGRVTMLAEYIALQIQSLVRWGTGTMLAVTLVAGVFALLALLSRLLDLRRLLGAR